MIMMPMATDSEKKICEMVHYDFDEFCRSHTLEIRHNVDQEALPACADRAVGVGMLQRHGVDADEKDDDQERGHQDLGHALDAFGNAKENDQRVQHQEDGHENDGLIAGDESAEVTVFRRLRSAGRHESHDVLQDPAADDIIIAENDDRDDEGQDAHEAPALFDGRISA